MKVTLAFYKAFGKPWDWLVRLVTLSRYSHVEIVLDDRTLISASPRDGGVRIKRLTPNPSHWDFVTVELKKTGMSRLDLLEMAGVKKYDWLGAIFAPVRWLKTEDPKRWFCSELVACYLGLENPSKYTPGRLYRKVKNDASGL